MLKIVASYLSKVCNEIDGAIVVIALFIIYLAVFIVNLFLEKTSARYRIFSAPFLVLGLTYLIFKKGYRVLEQLLMLFTILFGFLLFNGISELVYAINKKIKNKKVKIVESKVLPNIEIKQISEKPSLKPSNVFNYIKPQQTFENQMENINSEHVKQLINLVKEKPLTYTDKKSIDNIDYVLQKASNGSNNEVQIELNDALNSLLKLVAKYHV